MKHVTFLLGAYDPEPSPNGICCKKIIKQLIKAGYLVDCISNRFPGMKKSEIIDGAIINRIPYVLSYKYMELSKRKKNKIIKKIFSICSKMFRIIEKIVFSFFYPMISPINVNEYVREAKKKITNSADETIICINMPPDTILAGVELKKKFPNIRFISYLLDPFVPFKSNPFVTNGFHCKRKEKVERTVLTLSDLVVAQLEHSEYYNKVYGNEFSDKICYLGVPLLENREDNSYRYHTSNRTFVFAGSVSNNYRNPKYIIDVFKYIKNARLIMYITNDSSWLRDYLFKSENRNVEIKQRVSKEELDTILKNADGYVNIGNSLELYAPSKLIEYIGYGKIIISTYRIDNDSCKKYMDKYPHGLYIDERKITKIDAANIIESYCDNFKDVIGYDELRELYRLNTAEAFINICFN